MQDRTVEHERDHGEDRDRDRRDHEAVARFGEVLGQRHAGGRLAES